MEVSHIWGLSFSIAAGSKSKPCRHSQPLTFQISHFHAEFLDWGKTSLEACVSSFF